MIRPVSVLGLATLLLASGLLFSAPMAEAAVSDAVRAACEKKADKVTPPLRAGEREAYVTNCIADAATTKSGYKKKRY
ncbi:MAG: hypothetical protein AAF405_03715 [Pseudomonadota bacterium]